MQGSLFLTVRGKKAVTEPYLHIEGEVTGFCLLQITLRVLESHLQTVGLRLHLTELCLLPLGLHLLLQRKTLTLSGYS